MKILTDIKHTQQHFGLEMNYCCFDTNPEKTQLRHNSVTLFLYLKLLIVLERRMKSASKMIESKLEEYNFKA